MNAGASAAFAAFCLLAIADWGAVALRHRLEYVLKPACMIALFACAALADLEDPATRLPLLGALALCTAGDVFLMLPERDDSRHSYFVVGLAAFLAAHLSYIAAFAVAGFESGWLIAGVIVGACLALGVGPRFAAAAGRRTGEQLPVAAYVAVISAMVAAAVATGNPVAIAGGLCFGLSDTLIAQRRFVADFKGISMAIIVTYHLAQGLIVLSFV